jgi:hypothetical protein
MPCHLFSQISPLQVSAYSPNSRFSFVHAKTNLLLDNRLLTAVTTSFGARLTREHFSEERE